MSTEQLPGGARRAASESVYLPSRRPTSCATLGPAAPNLRLHAPVVPSQLDNYHSPLDCLCCSFGKIFDRIRQGGS